MCKTWSITYDCKHTSLIRLSMCRGTFIYTTKKLVVPKALCHGAPSLSIRSYQDCGTCQHTKAELELAAPLTEVDPTQSSASSWNLDGAVTEQRYDYGGASWSVEKKFPKPRIEKSVRPEKGPQATRSISSPLRAELRPEDIPDDVLYEGMSWEEEWVSGWKTMEEDLAEAEPEKPEEIKQYEEDMAKAYDDWLNSSTGEDSNADEAVTSHSEWSIENADSGWVGEAEAFATTSEWDQLALESDAIAPTVSLERQTMWPITESPVDAAASNIHGDTFPSSGTADKATIPAQVKVGEESRAGLQNAAREKFIAAQPAGGSRQELRKVPKVTSMRRKARSHGSITSKENAKPAMNCVAPWLTVST
jgi:hypothetical protein